MSYWKNQPGFDPDDLSSVKFGNRGQMDVFEQVLTEYPRLNIIGAHQLHVGYPKLEALLDRYPNLNYDISIGGFVRWGDQMRKRDAEVIRSHICRYADRILFGTDVHFKPDETYWRMREQHFLGHLRFIRQLDLPDDALQNVCWRNADRLYRLPPLELQPGKWGFLRP
jgi:predicted TIM-barrel fold metal-dependent hydrolase